MDFDVKIYTSAACGYCERAKKLLNSLGIKFEEVSVESNPEERARLIEEFNWMTVPAIFINGELIGGYDELAKMNAEGKLGV